MINIRLTEHFREIWIKTAKQSHKGLDYLQLSMFNYEMKDYIMNDKSIIQMLKIRTGNHTLAVEIYRYGNRREYDERICNQCDMHKNQDLYHVIIECPKFSEQRSENLAFLIHCNITELYGMLNTISRKQLKAITNFMEFAEEIIKTK